MWIVTWPDMYMRLHWVGVPLLTALPVALSGPAGVDTHTFIPSV